MPNVRWAGGMTSDRRAQRRGEDPGPGSVRSRWWSAPTAGTAIVLVSCLWFAFFLVFGVLAFGTCGSPAGKSCLGEVHVIDAAEGLMLVASAAPRCNGRARIGWRARWDGFWR